MSYLYNIGRIELYRQIKRHASFVKGRVLDIGAGNFSRYQNLFRFNEYIKMNIELGKNTDVVGRAEEIPFPDNSFDSLICTQVLGDIYELPKAFGEFYRVLRPGGFTLITENLFDSLHNEPHDFWRFTEYSLRQLAEDAGFKVEVLEKRGGYHSVVAQLKARYWIERLRLGQRWFDKIFSLIFKVRGVLAQWCDAHDQSPANKLFPRGYLLIVQKDI